MQMPDQPRYRKMKAIFREVCDHPSAERAALLDSACGDDLELRLEVERLLAHADSPVVDLEQIAMEMGWVVGAAVNGRVDPAPLPGVPARIGPYRVLRLISEGGMGEVFLAEQDRPKRLLAVKVIKAGIASRDMLRRFEHEAQTLGRLQHPGIARLYEAGTTEHGLPYLAMEFVDGPPITEYCDARTLSIEERMELFIKVCEAVQHAHMRGVIHRDLKPTNILVTEQSATDSGERRAVSGDAHWPRVIDFGIAKVLHESVGGGGAASCTVFTNPGVVVGTLAYMSPEQAAAGLPFVGSGVGSGDVDVRSDVYSLGVVLYQLLTGCLPHDESRLKGLSAADRERLLWERPLPRPSSRVGGLMDADIERAAQIAQNRRIELGPLVRQMKGELDWIVMKCLAPEKARRYDSVAALIDDLRRLRRDEPVLARPPSALYQARKFTRRHRTLVAGTGAFLLALLIGIAGTTWGLVHAVSQAERAEEESRRATTAEAEARHRAAELEQVVEFQSRQLSRIDAVAMGRRIQEAIVAAGVGSSEPDEATARDFERFISGINFTTIALRVLDESIYTWAAEEIESRFADQPQVQARLFQTLANTMRWNGLLEQAGRPQMRAVEIRRQVLGDEHALTLRSILEMGRLLKVQGRPDEAEPFIREALAGYRKVLGEDHTSTLYAVNVMGLLLRAQGLLDEAEPYYREALAGFRRVLSEDHRLTLFSVANLGSLLRECGRLDEAEPLIREALEGKRRRFGDDHLETLLSALDLGLLLQAQEKLGQAESTYQEVLERAGRSLGADHFCTLSTAHMLGVVLRQQGLLEEAEPYLRRALEGRRRVLGEHHRYTRDSARRLAQVLAETGRDAEAVGVLRLLE